VNSRGVYPFAVGFVRMPRLQSRRAWFNLMFCENPPHRISEKAQCDNADSKDRHRIAQACGILRLACLRLKGSPSVTQYCRNRSPIGHRESLGLRLFQHESKRFGSVFRPLFHGRTEKPICPRTWGGSSAVPGCHRKPTLPQNSLSHSHRLNPGSRSTVDPSGILTGPPFASRSSAL
jgi:hypothetical protein